MSSMFIAALVAIFAVGLLGLSMLIARDSGGAIAQNSGVFKTGNPSLAGNSAVLGVVPHDVDTTALEPTNEDQDPTTEARS